MFPASIPLFHVNFFGPTPPNSVGERSFTPIPRPPAVGRSASLPSISTWAVRLAVQHFRLLACRLCAYTDNETVRFTLFHLRTRSPFLRAELRALLEFVVDRHVLLTPILIPTDLNVVADTLSRATPSNTEWTLPSDAFRSVQDWAVNKAISCFNKHITVFIRHVIGFFFLKAISALLFQLLFAI